VQGALALPSSRLDRLFSKYRRLRLGLPTRKGEVKGFLLSDAQLVAVIDLLVRNEALFFPSFVDMAGQTLADIDRHRSLAIEALAANLTDGHPPELRANVAELQRRLATFPPQLYIQSLVIIDLLHHVLDQMLMYHAQRHPHELSAFHWVIDAKGVAEISDWEDWWSRTLVVWLQAISLEDPSNFLIGADYSCFDRFLLKEVPDYLKDRAPPNLDRVRGAGVDLQLMFGESFRFSSEPEPGLELVDIVTNALRRALRGNIPEKTWIQLGRLLIRRTDLNVRAVTMSFDDEMTFRPYARVVQKLALTGRDMLTAHHRRRLEQRSALERH
jgi:hypothetical protein